MSYQVFARKYRPRTFQDVLGQDHVVQTLRNAIEMSRLAHAYLFVGPRGTGKTSTARIFAKALNCPGGPKVDFDPDDPVCREIAEGNSLDVLEIDGASNNGVEQVRELRETVKYAPAHCKFKIYYIDEVHMLSTAAFNALLKTLEEPPAHVKFIFATTEPAKILPTIISRCQRFDLRRIPTPVIAEQLLHIARMEGVDLEEAAAYAVAKGADGGMRDAQSMLDQLVAFCGNQVREPDVLEIFGFTSMDLISELAGAILARQTVGALERLREQSERGKDLVRLMGDLIGYLRNLLVAQIAPDHVFLDLAPEMVAKLRGQTARASADRLLNLIDHFAETEAKMKWAANRELHFEVGIIKGMQILSETNLSDVIGILRQAGEAAGGAPQEGAAGNPGRGSGNAEPEAGNVKPGAEDERGTGRARGGRGINPDASRAGKQPFAAGQAAEREASRAEDALPGAGRKRDPGGENRGAALWSAVMEELEASKPMMAGWARAAVFLEEKEKQLVVGFAPGNSFYRDSLMREKSREVIEALIQQFGGRKLSLACELREEIASNEGSGEVDRSEETLEVRGLEAAIIFPDEALPEAGRAKRVPKSLDKSEKEPSAARKAGAVVAVPGAEVQPEVAPLLVDEQGSRDDELIQEALRLFEGELEQG